MYIIKRTMFGKEIEIESSLSEKELNYFCRKARRLLKIQKLEIDRIEFKNEEELTDYIFDDAEDVTNYIQRKHNLTEESLQELIELTNIRDKQHDLIYNYEYYTEQ